MPIPMIAGIRRQVTVNTVTNTTTNNNTFYNSGNAFDIGETFPRAQMGAPAALSTNLIYMTKIRFPKSMTITKLKWYVGATASANVQAGFYIVTTPSFQIDQVANIGTVAVSGSSNVAQSANLNVSYAVVPNTDYYICFQASTGTTLTIGRIGTQGPAMLDDNRCGSFAPGSFTLTTSITSISSVSSMPWVEAS